jgi:hypothetical protein
MLFECLGTVMFEGKTYAETTRLPPVFMSPTGGEVASTLSQQLTLWRTLLVDGETGLATYPDYHVRESAR